MRDPQFNNSYASLSDRFYQRALPETFPNPTLIVLNTALAENMDLDVDWLNTTQGLGMLSGQDMPEGADPIAMAYAGHQFGGWSPQLGDGRALLLGEIIAKDGTRLDVQLKGSGRTPFSRGGDGKAGLGPVLREYIVSEAMHAYGVPTTRALAACLTGATILRQEGEIAGAILTRVAQSHIRIGTFQYFYARGDVEALAELSDYVINRHFPDVKSAKNPYDKMLKTIIARQAKLIAKWMGLGFIHGVMNTDNMQIVGETIDYGPCAFMDVFHLQKTFSSIDRRGRYAWAAQPSMALWNLSQLAQALSPILDTDEKQSAKIAQSALETFHSIFQTEMNAVFRAKFGFTHMDMDLDRFLKMTFETMTEHEIDFTLFFRRLTKIANGHDEDAFLHMFNDPYSGKEWLSLWKKEIKREEGNVVAGQDLAVMQFANPIFIPRNHRIEECIQNALGGDFTLFHRLVQTLKMPFTEQDENTDLEMAPRQEEVVQHTFCGT
ncbi:MAG: hypothetical protein COA43_15700 [Robiginitomaculum sp.]|nr:MAG: hypothetical protein COA43_15700 [Robiginitomaculum sp.]